MKFFKAFLSLFLVINISLFAQNKSKLDMVKSLDQQTKHFSEIAETIWKWAEPGYQEEKTMRLMQNELKQEGFSFTYETAGMPTAFIASYGSGHPVIAVLAEMDALPGLSQDNKPARSPLVEGGYGHACGHNLFGTGSLAAAITIKKWMVANKIKGTIRLYATPAEEGAGGGKTYLVKAGVFNDVDAVLHWHPGDNNNASPSSSLAYKLGMFRFSGLAAHAAAAPEKGRSALDGAEAMNFMANMMREHISEDSRIHYVFKKGGLTSNIVPDFAEVEYTVRNPTVSGVEDIWKRLVKTSEAGAMGTGTTVTNEVMTGLYNVLPNETLAKIMQKNLEIVGGVNYTAEETEFAEKIRKTITSSSLPKISTANQVLPYNLNGLTPASTDVGDISWVVPTAGFSTATWVPGIPAHSWQAVACNGMSIGYKGMMVAAKTIALSAADLFLKPEVLAVATEELKKARGGDTFKYRSLAGDRTPPLDYRK